MCLLDVKSTHFSYRQLAAAVLFQMYEPSYVIERITGLHTRERDLAGLRYAELAGLLEWLEPFCQVSERRRQPGDPLRVLGDVASEDWHNIQSRQDTLSETSTMEEVREERRRLEHRRRPLRRL